MESRKEENIEFIIQGCIHKNEKYQELLYKKFFGYALSVAMMYNNNRSEALEVVDDSFMKVFSKIGHYDPSKPFQGWLRKILINTSIDAIRRNNKDHRFVEAEKSTVADETPGALSQLATQDIIGILNQLPHLHKTVFCLYEIEGYSHDEIAGQLGIPISSSRVYLTRAKQQLRELFPVNYLKE
ncbi:MAG: sigma-70 family RNA polymerase sigma factor [Prolixibacteraceae bacterium]